MTALMVVLFLEQLLKNRRYGVGIIGLASTLLCRFLFGTDRFIYLPWHLHFCCLRCCEIPLKRLVNPNDTYGENHHYRSGCAGNDAHPLSPLFRFSCGKTHAALHSIFRQGFAYRLHGSACDILSERHLFSTRGSRRRSVYCGSACNSAPPFQAKYAAIHRRRYGSLYAAYSLVLNLFSKLAYKESQYRHQISKYKNDRHTNGFEHALQFKF